MPKKTPQTVIEIPDMPRLAEMYRKAISAKDLSAAGIAEHAALRFARGEAMILEANLVSRFINEIG